MKIYFIGSSEGERYDFDQEVAGLLSEYGEVVRAEASDDLDAGYVYERSIDWIQEADVIVAEVSAPSTGLGYQIGIAEAAEKRILAIYRETDNERPSAMVLGNRKLSVAEYETVEDLEGVFRDFF